MAKLKHRRPFVMVKQRKEIHKGKIHKASA